MFQVPCGKCRDGKLLFLESRCFGVSASARQRFFDPFVNCRHGARKVAGGYRRAPLTTLFFPLASTASSDSWCSGRIDIQRFAELYSKPTRKLFKLRTDLLLPLAGHLATNDGRSSRPRAMLPQLPRYPRRRLPAIPPVASIFRRAPRLHHLLVLRAACLVVRATTLQTDKHQPN